MRNSSG